MVQDNWQRTIEYVRLSLTEACNFCCLMSAGGDYAGKSDELIDAR